MYESEPDYQRSYSIAKAKTMRAIPDVSYDADPKTGFPIYVTSNKKGAWYRVGGTSAGAPQWAAIEALGQSISLAKLYSDKASTGTLQYFRDITSGKNGTCTYYCDARKRYDYVTGLGSPLTVRF
jgi:subtilase family serine protease